MAARQTGQSARKTPISRHPAFPAIVALWFAALLGVGSLVVPAAVFENLIVATGLPAAVPAAQPPLDIGARILIALIGAGVGVIAGLYIARKVADAQGARPAKRPISAREELGAESFDEPVEDASPGPVRKRRRALALAEGGDAADDAAEAPFAAAAPEACNDTVAAPTTRFAQPPLDLSAFSADAEIDAETPAETGVDPSAGFARPGAFAAPEETFAAEPEAREFAPEAPAVSTDCPADLPIADDETETESPTSTAGPRAAAQDSPLHELSIAELVERFALALQRAAGRAAATAASGELAAPGNVAASPAPERPAARYVPDLGIEADEAPEHGFASGIPAALRPAWADEPVAEWEEDDEEDHLSFTLPLADIVRDDGDEGEDDDSEETSAEEGYSSLLNIRPAEPRHASMPAGTEDETFGVRPVVAFPGETPEPASASAGRPFDAPARAGGATDRAQAERALREALHKLQRMSGAA